MCSVHNAPSKLRLDAVNLDVEIDLQRSCQQSFAQKNAEN